MSDKESAPDSWESVADAANGINKLNVSTRFVPNVNAAVFVPSFLKDPEPEDPGPGSRSSASSQGPSIESSPQHTSNSQSRVDSPAKGKPVRNNDAPADSWEEAADAVVTPSPTHSAGSTPLHSASTPTAPITPDDDEDDSEIEEKKSKKTITSSIDDGPHKEPVNVIFIGHVDAGKSTIGGQIMYLTGMVDKRTLEKYEREAKEKNRESWYLSWALDTNLEERDKGKTVEIGRAYFETEKKHFTILDAPGHKSFVPNMIGGASQADLAVLVISARKGEFETGFERGGQTREHATLAKTAGVKHLIVLINKMDDPTVQWSKQRYSECKDKLVPYLKKIGFNPNRDIMFMPCSGLTGFNLRERVDDTICPWYTGPAFIPYINDLPTLNRNLNGHFMMPIAEKFNDRGTIVMGKIESGSCRKNDSMILMPNKASVSVDVLWRNEEEVTNVQCGENVKIKLRGVEEGDIMPGFLLCDPIAPCKTGRVFDGEVVILEHRSIICAGYSAVCHIHSVAEEVTVKALICIIDKKSGERQKFPRFVKQDQHAIMRFETSGVICMERFLDHPQLGRFTLRDEGKTIAIGKVRKVVE